MNDRLHGSVSLLDLTSFPSGGWKRGLVACTWIDALRALVCGDSSLPRRLLSHVELMEWERRWRSGSRSGRAWEWLAGRVALKSCAVSWLERLEGGSPGFDSLTVLASPRPGLAVDGSTVLPAGCSITHSSGLAAAWLDPSGGPNGIDVELFGRERSAVWARLVPSCELLAVRIRGGGGIVCWSMREAVIKAVGGSVPADMRRLRLGSIRGADGLWWRAGAELDGRRFVVCAVRYHRYVLAFASTRDVRRPQDT